MYPNTLVQLIENFRKLPGVGEKTAERYALAVCDMNEADVEEFSGALKAVREKLKYCPVCGNLTDREKCEICSDPDRNQKQIFVVQSAKDVIAIERTARFRGVYHVLNGLISTSKGIMPEDLNMDSLVRRAGEAEEIILATNTTMDGERQRCIWINFCRKNIRIC
jgi:recombination protein RecR